MKLAEEEACAGRREEGASRTRQACGDATTRENDAVKRVADEIQSVIAGEQKERADTVNKERNALAAALRRVQDTHVERMLRTSHCTAHPSLESAIVLSGAS